MTRKFLWLTAFCISISVASLQAQMTIGSTAAPTTGTMLDVRGKVRIADGGYITVGNGGNWYMGGSITSTDKGNANTPNSPGRSERILFAGTGTYSNGETVSGGSGNIIDAYATALGKTGAFTLPVGANGLAYPVTIYSSTQVTAAYFPGTGSSQTNVTINDFPDNPATVYSPYPDMPDGIPTGDYDFSYPGFSTPSHACCWKVAIPVLAAPLLRQPITCCRSCPAATPVLPIGYRSAILRLPLPPRSILASRRTSFLSVMPIPCRQSAKIPEPYYPGLLPARSTTRVFM